MDNKFRIHVGLVHAKTTREYSCDAFTQLVRVFCKMMTNNFHQNFSLRDRGFRSDLY